MTGAVRVAWREKVGERASRAVALGTLAPFGPAANAHPQPAWPSPHALGPSRRPLAPLYLPTDPLASNLSYHPTAQP